MKTLLETAYDAWKTEGTRFWAVFSVMSAINGGLFVGVFLRGSSKGSVIVVAGLGIALCCIWFGIQRRLAFWVAARLNKVVELEECYIAEANRPKAADDDNSQLATLAIPTGISLFKDFTRRNPAGLELVDSKLPGISASRVGGCAMPVIFVVGWLLVGLGGGEPMAFDMAENWDEIVKLLLAVTGLTCFCLGYRLLAMGLTTQTRPKTWAVPGGVFTALGISAWVVLLRWLWSM